MYDHLIWFDFLLLAMEGEKAFTYVYTLRFNAFDGRAKLNAERAYIAAALMGLKARVTDHLAAGSALTLCLFRSAELFTCPHKLRGTLS